MTRRSFLSLAAAAAACRRSGARPEAPVVIVGAGLAGLRTADLLVRAGRAVVVLEARDTPGGRVRTIRSGLDDELHGEAGAARIAAGQTRVLALAQEHRLRLMPFASSVGAPLLTVHGQRVRVPDELEKLAAPLRLQPHEVGLTPGALLSKYVGDLPPELQTPVPDADLLDRWAVDDAKTWPEWLHARGASDGAIALMTLGGDSRKLSALYVLRQMAHMPASGEFYKISGGMDRLAHALALRAGDRVRYGARVVRVDVTPEAAHVEYTQRDRTIVLRASRVVFTIPFSTLRRVDIRPPLRPDKAGVIAELPYYPATRLLLQTRSPFWADRDLSGAARTDDPAEFWDAAYETGGPRGLLAATLGAAPALELGDLTESAALARGVALAARSFPSVSRELETGRVVRWALDPWAAGAFAVYHAGQMTSWLPHVSRAEGRLHFAGEHSSAWMGWMEGALESAERVAREVLV